MTKQLDNRILSLLLEGKRCREMCRELALPRTQVLAAIRRLMNACADTQRGFASVEKN